MGSFKVFFLLLTLAAGSDVDSCETSAEGCPANSDPDPNTLLQSRISASNDGEHDATLSEELAQDMSTDASEVVVEGDVQRVEEQASSSDDCFNLPLILTSHYGQYLQDNHGSLRISDNKGSWEKWVITDAGDNKVFITSHRNMQLEDRQGSVGLHGDKGSYQKWSITSAGDDKVFVNSHRNERLEDRHRTVGVHSDRGPWQKWTITIARTGEKCTVSSLQAACPVGYKKSPYDLNGGGKEFSANPDGTVEGCASICNQRSGCTGFEFNKGGHEDYKCATYTDGHYNVQSGPQDYRWQSCVEAACPFGYKKSPYVLNGGGKEFSANPDGTVEGCASLCNKREGCTGFEFNKAGDENFKCATIGQSNVLNREQSPHWQSCIVGLAQADEWIRDTSKDGKKCAVGSNRVFDLRGSAANERQCGEACTENADCEAWSMGQLGRSKWCIGCNVPLGAAQSGAQAYMRARLAKLTYPDVTCPAGMLPLTERECEWVKSFDQSLSYQSDLSQSADWIHGCFEHSAVPGRVYFNNRPGATTGRRGGRKLCKVGDGRVPYLKYVGVNGACLSSPHAEYNRPCSRCQGSCQRDSDCAGGLKCWRRRGLVPGCVGGRPEPNAGPGWAGYCYQA